MKRRNEHEPGFVLHAYPYKETSGEALARLATGEARPAAHSATLRAFERRMLAELG